MSVIDLTNEKCPMHLVKFKVDFYNLQQANVSSMIRVLMQKDQKAIDGILRFLELKQINVSLSHTRSDGIAEIIFQCK